MQWMDNPWKTAEDAVFKAFCEGTGTVAKATAFLGYLPPIPNVWSMKMGGGGDVRNTWSENITELHMNADIEGVFLERDQAQLFAQKIIKLMPIKRIANVQGFRLRAGEMPVISFVDVTLANQQPSRVWTVDIGCEVVFNTQERANVEPIT